MAFKGWQRVKMTTDEGQTVDSVAPEIISASRSTDIPAFYADWFINRLKKGYVRWINPFNGKSQYVAFCNTRLIVFWTKNPVPVIKYLDGLKAEGINSYFHFTLNDYEKEGFEKNVPPLGKRISAFKELSLNVGKENIIWRFDPIIICNQIKPQQILDRIQFIGNQIHSYTNRLTISFISMYEKVKRNFKKAGIDGVKNNVEAVREIGSGLKQLNKNWNLQIVSCAEKMDLHEYGICRGACIDPDLILKNFGDDLVLQQFLGDYGSNDLFGYKSLGYNLKDPGQRPLCRCIVSKDIGRYNTCPHLCLYCYANSTEQQVLNNLKNYKFKNDSL